MTRKLIEVEKLFKTRDQAVQEKNRQLFLSTQVEEIPGSSSTGYLSIDKLETKVLDVIRGNKISQGVAVKEKYYKNKKMTHQSFLICHLIKTSQGWKIAKITH